MKATSLLMLFLSNIIFISNSEVECDGTVIEHCSKCSTGENSDACSTCDDYYFPFLSDLYCLPCNDSIYGQIGCKGKCNGTNYINTRFAFCEKEGCAEGYYNINGSCIKCNMDLPNCKRCTYEISEQETNGSFICHECENNEYLLSYGECKLCNTSLSYCQKCHYDNKSQAVCDKCSEGYYLDSNGKCKECYYKNIYGGRCYVCSINETEYDYCYCYNGYTKKGYSECRYCSSPFCSECFYNDETGKTECLGCRANYILNSDKTCISCGDECNSCEFGEDNNIICLSCKNHKP